MSGTVGLAPRGGIALELSIGKIFEARFKTYSTVSNVLSLSLLTATERVTNLRVMEMEVLVEHFHRVCATLANVQQTSETSSQKRIRLARIILRSEASWLLREDAYIIDIKAVPIVSTEEWVGQVVPLSYTVHGKRRRDSKCWPEGLHGVIDGSKRPGSSEPFTKEETLTTLEPPRLSRF